VIIRSPRPQSHFTIVPNAAIRDTRLSWKARGLLVYLLSMPDNWRTNTAQLRAAGIDGRDAIRAGLTELEEVGYLARRRMQRNDGTFTWVTVVYDTTVQDPVDKAEVYPQPWTGFPATDNPSSKEVLREEVLQTVSKSLTGATRQVCGRCNGSGLYASRSTAKILRCPICTDGTIKAVS
jgi:hypothetical protein